MEVCVHAEDHDHDWQCFSGFGLMMDSRLTALLQHPLARSHTLTLTRPTHPLPQQQFGTRDPTLTFFPQRHLFRRRQHSSNPISTEISCSLTSLCPGKHFPAHSRTFTSTVLSPRHKHFPARCQTAHVLPSRFTFPAPADRYKSPASPAFCSVPPPSHFIPLQLFRNAPQTSLPLARTTRRLIYCESISICRCDSLPPQFCLP